MRLVPVVRYALSFSVLLFLLENTHGSFVGPWIQQRSTPAAVVLARLHENNNNHNHHKHNEGFSTKFNPFDYKNKNDPQSAYGFSGNQISLRKTRMQQIVNELLNVVDDENRTRAILDESATFLLEPLECSDVLLDPDDYSKMYHANMTRDERYAAYERSMQERLLVAKHKSVRNVLTALRDYVLSHRDKKSVRLAKSTRM
jgi:hypothetical protein